MRRLFSIALTLLLALGTLGASMPADAMASGTANGWTGKVDDSKLPACCRKHGVHHCNMDSEAESPGQTTVSAANCCPRWPHTLASTVAPFAAIFTPAARSRSSIELRSAPQAAIAAGISQRRTWPKRGPPASQSQSV
jgi:hypothetical protein